MKCPLCGYKIDENDVLNCLECPLRKDCTIKKCPNCGYALVETRGIESKLKKLKDLLFRIFNRGKQ